MRVFIDTNLWAYRLDRREPAKSARLKPWLAQMIADHDIVISTQVLIELRAVASRKLQPPLPASAAVALCSFPRISAMGAGSPAWRW